MSKKDVDLMFSMAKENSKRGRTMTKLESLSEAKLDKFSEEGNSYFLQENYHMAISSFEKAIEAVGEDLYGGNYDYTRSEQREENQELYIKDAEIRLSLGKALLRQNSIEPTEAFIEKSINAFTAVINLAEDAEKNGIDLDFLHEAFYNRGLAYLEKSKGILGDNNVNLAIEDFDTAIALNDTIDAYYFYRGKSHFQNSRDNFSMAKADLLKACEMNPNVADYYFWLGEAFAWSSPQQPGHGELPEEEKAAIRYYQKALKIDPNHEETISILKRMQKELGDSINVWNEDSNAALSKEYFEFGIEQFNKAQYGDAIDLFKKGIETDPKNGICYLYMGITHIFQRDTEKAKPFIAKAVGYKSGMKRHYDYYDILAEGIQCFHYDVHNRENINKAWDLLHEGTEGFPYRHDAPQYTPDVFLFFLGLAHFEYQNRSYSDTDSFCYLEDAIEINPNHVVYYYERGRISVESYYAEQEPGSDSRPKSYLKDAVEYFEKAIELDPVIADADFYYCRGQAKFEAPISRGFFKPDEYDTAGAIVDIEQAICMDDSKGKYYVALAFMYFEFAQESSENYSHAVILLKKPSILK